VGFCVGDSANFVGFFVGQLKTNLQQDPELQQDTELQKEFTKRILFD
jgi:hypothetical protein